MKEFGSALQKQAGNSLPVIAVEIGFALSYKLFTKQISGQLIENHLVSKINIERQMSLKLAR